MDQLSKKKMKTAEGSCATDFNHSKTCWESNSYNNTYMHKLLIQTQLWNIYLFGTCNVSTGLSVQAVVKGTEAYRGG